MPIDWDLAIKVAGPLLGAVAGAVAKHLSEAKPDVVAFLQHASGIHLPNAQPPGAIGTHTVVLANNGRKPATNVRLGHNTLPAFAIYPGIQYTVSTLPGGQQEIQIPSLVPKKQLTITYMYPAPLQWQQVNTHLEHDEGPVRVLNVLPTVQRPAWVRRTLWSLAGLGGVTALYLLAHAVSFLYSQYS
jgi:hypothetical protein